MCPLLLSRFLVLLLGLCPAVSILHSELAVRLLSQMERRTKKIVISPSLSPVCVLAATSFSQSDVLSAASWNEGSALHLLLSCRICREHGMTKTPLKDLRLQPLFPLRLAHLLLLRRSLSSP